MLGIVAMSRHDHVTRTRANRVTAGAFAHYRCDQGGLPRAGNLYTARPDAERHFTVPGDAIRAVTESLGIHPLMAQDLYQGQPDSFRTHRSRAAVTQW